MKKEYKLKFKYDIENISKLIKLATFCRFRNSATMIISVLIIWMYYSYHMTKGATITIINNVQIYSIGFLLIILVINFRIKRNIKTIYNQKCMLNNGKELLSDIIINDVGISINNNGIDSKNINFDDIINIIVHENQMVLYCKNNFVMGIDLSDLENDLRNNLNNYLLSKCRHLKGKKIIYYNKNIIVILIILASVCFIISTILRHIIK